MAIRQGWITVVAILACGCGRQAEADRYARWMAPSNAAQARAYATYLIDRNVGDVLPIPQLLRSGRSWRPCKAAEFAVPPKNAWPAMVRTLALVRELQRQRLLRGSRVASSYRDEAFNRCEGGSPLSRHRVNNALDFDLPFDPERVRSLCTYWRRHGTRLHFGLGFYDNRRIHVDTSGFRTWGTDYTHATSLCPTSPR